LTRLIDDFTFSFASSLSRPAIGCQLSRLITLAGSQRRKYLVLRQPSRQSALP